MILYPLITVLILIVAYVKWKTRHFPPGPWGLPILGYLPFLDAKHPYLTFTKLSRKYGPVYGLYLGNVYTVVLTDPKLIRQLFSKDATTGRAPLYLTHGIMKGYGLICAEGALWKEHRRFVHNCLRELGCSKIGSQRERMQQLIMEHALDFVKYVENLGDGATLDPLEPLRHSLGSVINIIVFGKSWSYDDETWKWLQRLQEEGTQHIGVAGPLNFLPFLRFVPKFNQTMNFLIDGKHETHKVYQKIIDEQADWLKQQAPEDVVDKKNCDSVLQAFLAEREKRKNFSHVVKRFYSDEQFYHLLADLFGAGLDTTLTTLRWYLLYMAKNISIQKSVRREIEEFIGTRRPTVDDIPHLPLVEASIHEAQRIRPVVPVGIPHGTLEEMEINGYHIPKGTMLVPLQWALHMSRKVWDRPERYDPFRFLDHIGQPVKYDNFMPFQVGKRMCVGDELAKMLLFLFAVTILQNFTIEPENENVDLTGECGITLTPKPHKLIFNKVPSY